MNHPRIIHNEEHVSRHLNLLEQLTTQKIKEYSFESPVIIPKNGTLGVSKAHRNIVKKYYDSEEITIFEDDIVFTSKKSWKKYWKWKEELPEDWDVYLGGYYTFTKRLDVTENLDRIGGFFTGLHWYTIRKPFYDRFLEHSAKSSEKNIDRYIGYTGAKVYAPKLLPSRQMELEFEEEARSIRASLDKGRDVKVNLPKLRAKNNYLL